MHVDTMKARVYNTRTHTRVHICIDTHVCMYSYTHACTLIHGHAHILYAYACTRIHIRTHLHTHMETHMHTCMHTLLYTCIHVCAYIALHTRARTHTCVHSYAHVYTHAHTSIYTHGHIRALHAHIVPHMCAHVRTLIHRTGTYPYVHTCTPAHTYCQTYTRTPAPTLGPVPPKRLLSLRVCAHPSCPSVGGHLLGQDGRMRQAHCFCSRLGLGTPRLMPESDCKRVRCDCAGGWRAHRMTSASGSCLM